MELLSRKTLVMILSGGKGERLYPLTRDRAKPSVPFLGSYRIIDFSLSNALNSGLRRIALLTQYKSLSLERHILNGWNIFHAESGDYIISLQAQGRVGDHWYEGTADAVLQNIYSIQQENPAAVLVLSGDHVYKMDYRKLLLFLGQTEADAVVMTRVVPLAEATRFGVIGVDQDRRIVEFLEKPRKPFPIPWDPGKSLISMGVYLFGTAFLIKTLLKDARNPKSAHDFGRSILPAIIRNHRVYAFFFEDYWEDIGTVDAYWQANMAFLGPSAPAILNDPVWPFRTYKPQYPPTLITGGDITNSMVCPGSVLSGGLVENSILSPGVRVNAEAEVRDSILLEGVEVGRRARLDKVIIDKFSVIPEGFEVGRDADADARNFKISRAGVRVIPKGWKAE
jgi:glucose-1-phosphate adenylyltransferase